MSMKLCIYEEWNKTQHSLKFSQIFLTITVFVLLDLVTVVGNLMVITDVVMKKRLRATAKTLILSLATADLVTGIATLPINAINEVLQGYWIFGDLWCIVNITLDAWLCTTSIYSTIAIITDRLIAITKPLHYSILVTRDRIYMTVVAIWTYSFLLCSPNFLLVNTYKSADNQCRCIPVYAGRIYIIISASLSFYIPMVLVTFISTKIYIITRRARLLDIVTSFNVDESKKKLCSSQYKVFRGNIQINMENIRNMNKNETARSKGKRNIKENTVRSIDSNIHSAAKRELRKPHPHRLKHTTSEPEMIRIIQKKRSSEQFDILIAKDQHQGSLLQIFASPSKTKFCVTEDKKQNLQTKTTEMITIISGCVIFCRLFYSILYGFSLNVSPHIWSISFCMGHVNSALNPVIYLFVNRDFRNYFKEFFTCSTNGRP
ncbi:unnamed protein product [Cercopithifilaria johnstoni]|uniref:G-protein coupled receptors family 1 profile domain-containing protein n=1 Tax=Cercopithifilaria johnstoni TaxID=2874296 RepID=A0A8J2LKW3_9BILA|nr:unnamed protein product [Cercopithifilaria johnstoni]